MKGNFLHPDNCNKAKCKTCIFGETPIDLSPERINEINSYLIKMESSHVCHMTNKTCYGGMELQAKVLCSIGVIEHPTVDCMLTTASKFLKPNKQ